MARLIAILVGVAALAGCGGDRGSVTGTWSKGDASAEFEGGRLTGSDGCNRYTATYEIDGDALRVGRIATTRMACPKVDDPEFTAKLERTRRFERDGDALVLLDDGGDELLRLQRTRASTNPS